MNPILFGAAFGLAIFGGSSISHFDSVAECDIGSKLDGDHKRVIVTARIGFESLFGEIPSVDIDADNFSCDFLPFRIEDSYSRYGKIRRLRFHLEHFTIHNLPIASMNADLRGTRFDFGYALARNHIRLTKSGSGALTVVFDLKDIKSFALWKYPQIHELEIESNTDGLRIIGSATVGAFALKFSVTGEPGIEAGTRLVLLHPKVQINGKALEGESSEAFLKPFTPLVDLDRDLGAEGGIHLDQILLKGSRIVGTGTVRIPDLKSANSGSIPNAAVVAKEK